MPSRGCSRTCRRLLERAAAVVAGQGRAELVLGSGHRTSAWRFAPDGGALLVLAPRCGARSLGLIDDDLLDDDLLDDGPDGRWRAVDTELPATARVHGADPAAPAVHLHGWLCAAPPPVVSRLAVRFAERHPTTDLLGAGQDWFLLRLEVLGATVTGSGRVLDVPHETVCRWLAAGAPRPLEVAWDSLGDTSTGGPRPAG